MRAAAAMARHARRAGATTSRRGGVLALRFSH
jgi:hypothetical protein